MKYDYVIVNEIEYVTTPILQSDTSVDADIIMKNRRFLTGDPDFDIDGVIKIPRQQKELYDIIVDVLLTIYTIANDDEESWHSLFFNHDLKIGKVKYYDDNFNKLGEHGYKYIGTKEKKSFTKVYVT